MPLKTIVDEPPSMNLTSMIDVCLLIIVFMVGTQQYAELERDIELSVPRVADAGALTSAPEQRVVDVHYDGRVALDRQEVTLAELTGRLATARSQYADLGVVVRGDGDGAFQRVAEVLSACKQAGISELAISVRLANQ